MANSQKYNLNKADGFKILKGAVIVICGSFLTYLAGIVPNVNFGEQTVLVAGVLMILINAGLKFFAGK